MEQLDLFSSKPTTETTENKVLKVAAPVKDEKQVLGSAGLAMEEPLAEPEFIAPMVEEEASAINEIEQAQQNDAVIFFEEDTPLSQEKIEVKHDQVEANPTKVDDAPSVISLPPRGKPSQKRGRKSFAEINAEVDLINIPEDEILFKKQYYSISEVAGWFNVNTSLLRFWETEFDILKPRKNRKGDRMFRPEDVKNLQLIYHLLRDRKYTIDGAKDYIKGNKKKADTHLQVTQSLQKFKSFLLELRANLQ